MATLQSNRISVIPDPAQMNKVKEALNVINEALPFLTGLTPKERQIIPKISTTNKVFVEDSVNAMKANAGMLPAYMNVEELEKDLALYNALDPVVQQVLQLSEKLSDTQMLAGSEAYVSALAAYRLFGAAATGGVPGADTVYGQLAQRFAGQGVSSNPKPPANDSNPENEVK